MIGHGGIIKYSPAGVRQGHRVLARPIYAHWERLMIALTAEQRETVERRFRTLADQWAELTLYRSNLGALRRHPVYQDLVGLGEPAIPLILKELERRPSVSWFGVLVEITDENPVPTELAGHVAAMAEAWLEWGKGRGYVE
jgi:hypothetical protein